MRQKHLIVLLLILTACISGLKAAAPPLLDWQNCFGGSGQDMPVKMIPTSDGGSIVLGSSASIDGNLTFNHGSSDIWLTKLDSSGGLVWQHAYGGSSLDIGTGLLQLPDGSIVLSGYTSSSNGDVTGNHGNFDVWLVKTDALGNLLWEKTFGGSQVDLSYAMIPSGDGGFLLGGGTYSNDGDVSSNHGDQDFWLLKADSTGTLLWQRALGGTGLDVCYGLNENQSGEIVACGSTNSSDGDVNGNHGGTDFWVVKLNPAGGLVWQRCLGGSDQDAGLSICSDLFHQYLVSGYSKSADGDVTDNRGYNDFWAVLLDDNGNLNMQRTFGGSGADIAYASMQTADGGFILAGGSTSTDWDINSNHGMEDVWLTKIDANLEIEWTKSYGGSGNERPSCIYQTADGGFVVGAYTYSNSGDVYGNHGGSDFWIFRLSCKTPVAAWTMPYDSVCTGALVRFQNQSQQSSSYTWLIDGTVFSQSENPVLQFPLAGGYTIALSAQTCYSTDTIERLISAIAPVQPVIQMSSSHLCTGDALLLSATAGTAYLWSTGETTQSITIYQGGNFEVTVSQSGCPASSPLQSVSEYPKPQLWLGNDTSICSGTGLTLQAGGGAYTYTWQDGSASPIYTVTNPGLYSVLVSDAWCSSSDTIRIDTFSCSLPVASFTVGTQQICAHSGIVFQDLSSNTTSWNWTFPGGNPGSSSLENPVVVYDIPGAYNVILVVSNSNGQQTLMRLNYIVVHELPAQPEITVSGNLLTSTPATSYQWIADNVTISGANFQSYTALQNGMYQVMVTNQYQCSSLSDPVYVSATSVQALSEKHSIRVSPNPAHQQIKILLTKAEHENGMLTIFNNRGQFVFEKAISSEPGMNEIQLGLDDFPEGIYFIRFTGDRGTTSTFKFQKY